MTKRILFVIAILGLLFASCNLGLQEDLSYINIQPRVANSNVDVTYTIADDWGAGFVVNVTMTNNGTTAIDGWTLEWTFSGDQNIIGQWNGDLTQTGQKVVVKNIVWNNIIQPGNSRSFGFQGTYTGTNVAPEQFVFNGDGGTVGIKPTASITAPLNNAEFTTGDNVTIDATAVDSDGTVSKVEFFNGDTLLGSDTTAPYSYTIVSATAGSLSLKAVATDNDGDKGESEIVTVLVKNPPPTNPEVSITSPANNSTVTSGDNIVINATATDSNGTISKVEFFNGTTLLGSDVTAPYSYTMVTPADAIYNLTAKATDNDGETGFSPVVVVQVKPPVTGLELVENGDFSKLGYYWKKRDHYQNFMQSQRVAESALTVESGVAVIDVKNRGTASWNLHLMQAGLVIENGESYMIKLDAKTDITSDITMDIAIKKIVSDWRSYVPSQSPKLFSGQEGHAIKVNNAWTTYEIPFTMTQATDEYANLELNYGKTLNGESENFTLYIDNVSVIKTSSNTDPRIRTIGGGVSNPVADNGDLSVVNGKVVNAAGTPLQLKGMSTHGMQWEGVNYSNREAMIETKDKWGANVFRLAMYVGQGGYIENKSVKYEMMRAIEDAIDIGMYVIIDWHIHNEQGNPNSTSASLGGKTYNFKQEAKDFFTEMAAKYGAYDNVIFEIANEPNGSGGSWANCKDYAEEIIPIIRAKSDNLIIVGTPTWSQDVDIATADPLTGANATNIAYSFHFYANTHKVDSFGPRIQKALDRGYAIFVSEWGTPDASGNGSINLPESEKWLNWLEARDIGWCNWHLSDEDENSAALKMVETGVNPIPSQSGGWKDSELRESGLFVKQKMLE